MPQEQESDLENGAQEEQNGEVAEDVALRPGQNADDAADVERYISAEVLALYDVYS